MLIKSAIKILVIDDEHFTLKLVVHMLANLGFTQVSACDSGAKALDIINSWEGMPDLILLDLNMPEMDGIEFMRHLVELRYAGSLSLISCEDERMLQTADKLIRTHHLQALGHLRKPFTPENLAALLETWTPPNIRKLQPIMEVYGADEIRAAIATGQLINYYQPKVNVASGKVVGVEALVRWRHPLHGLVFPDRFIAVAETHGLIDDLTRIVIEGALLQTKSWNDIGLHLRVAINISMDNLSSLDFVEYLATTAHAVGINPEDIILEMTESQLMKGPSTALEILTRLRLKRFNLSIDDFGTGYSSLIQLRDIPFNELKIDRGFVHGAADNITLSAIYETSLSLAERLNINTVAEGVEDRDDWDFLRRTGCELAQGYFIAKPMPPTDIPDWITAWEANLEYFLQ